MRKRKYNYFYTIQTICEDGYCNIVVESFEKTEEGLAEAYKKLRELNRKEPGQYTICITRDYADPSLNVDLDD
jgi:hypothetical protein